MTNKLPHYRPFNHEHARAGAPFSTIDGRAVEIIRWDVRGGECPLLGIVENGTHGQLAVRWATDGVQHAERTADEQLVMTPLGICEGLPVFPGDQLWDVMADDGYRLFTVSVHAREFSHCMWPRSFTESIQMSVTLPDMERTPTGFTMFGKEYVQVELLSMVAEAVYRDMQARARSKVDLLGGIHVCMPHGIDIPAIIKRVRQEAAR